MATDDAFGAAQEVEKLAEVVLLPYMERQWPQCTYYVTRHHPLIQKFCGDWLVKWLGRAKYIELKAELNKTGNLFIETWSNRQRRTVGWFHVCQADWIWYYFINDHELYIFPIQSLRDWARENADRFLGYPERRQGKYTQKNDTWGRCVPITVLQQGVEGFHGPINPTATGTTK